MEKNGCPAILDLTGRLCVIVGGGRGAAVKARALSGAGARLRIVAENISEELHGYEAELIRRRYRTGDTEGAFLVFALTGDAETDRRVCTDAKSHGVLVGGKDIVLPAVAAGENITAFVSTGYPKLSAKLTRGLLSYDGICGMLRGFRDKVNGSSADAEARTAALEAAVSDEALDTALRSSEEYKEYLAGLEAKLQ